jgi:hypothetical protein
MSHFLPILSLPGSEYYKKRSGQQGWPIANDGPALGQIQSGKQFSK